MGRACNSVPPSAFHSFRIIAHCLFPSYSVRYDEDMEIDLNSDLGEGCPLDADLMPWITSANIACGFHAGNVKTIHAALSAATKHGVQAGAHPGFDDREHFGRRELTRSEQEIYNECLFQVGGLAALAAAEGLALKHLKPHGALYNMACRDDAYARPLVAVAERLALTLVGLPGSRMESLSRGRCRFVSEGFADRRYMPNGSLVPRTQPNAFIHDPEEAVRQVTWLISEKKVRTICVHGDNPQALDFVRQLRDILQRAGFEVRAFA
jgi:5-oxoprolinase (ATP-hydrolysing) subunit A